MVFLIKHLKFEMNQKYYKVSPNEEVALHKKAFKESKMKRLKEVREQEKLVSAALLNKTKNNKVQHVQDMLNNLKIEFEGKKKKEIDSLLKQLNNRFKSIGEGHNFVCQEDGKMKELTAAERALVTKRYKRAVNKILKEKALVDASVAEQAELRKKIISMEEDRKKAILSLPKPPPDPIANLKPIKVVTSITKNQTVDSFALSHYNLHSVLSSFPEILVEKVSEENQVDAKLSAKEEEIKYKVLQEKLLKESNEREEKAELRHKHALQEVQLRQQQEDLIGELNNLELKDRLHRKNVVAKISNKVFQPPYQRSQESKMKQMNLEQAFENAYNPTPGDATENYYKYLDESNSSCNLQNDSSEAKDKEKDKENLLDNLSVRRKDKDTIIESNQKENEFERSKEDSQPIALSRLEKLRMHIKQQKRSQKSSEDLATNTIQDSNQSTCESSSSKSIITTASTQHIESLQSMNISSACESQLWRFSTHAPTEDHSTSSLTVNGQEKVLSEKLTTANLNYSQRLLEHQQDVLKFQESLLRNQVLNTKAAVNHAGIPNNFINKSHSSVSSSQCLTQASTMVSVALNSQHKLTSVSSGHIDDFSLKQYSLSKIDNSFSSFETSQQASEHSILVEKMTCEVQIQTSFVECDGATQTSFNERTNENSSDKNPSKKSDPELTLNSCAERGELTSKLSSAAIPSYEKIKNKKIALRQQYPELFVRDSNSTERVRDYKQRIKDQQKKIKLVHEFKKEKNERNENIDSNTRKDYEQFKGKQSLVLPKSFNDADKTQLTTKQQNLSFPVFDKLININANIDVNNIEEYKQPLTSHFKQTNLVGSINNKQFIDKNNKQFIDKINSSSELSLLQSNVELHLREKDLPNTDVTPDLLSNAPSTSETIFKKSISPFINTVPMQTKKCDDLASLVNNHSIEQEKKKENVDLENNSGKDRVYMLDSRLERQSFSELMFSASPPQQILSKNIKPSLVQNYLNNSNFFHEFYQNNIPDYSRINRVSEDPPFSPIYEVDEKTPYRLADVASSITSLQEQFLSSPSVTNQSSPTVTFHSLPAKHTEFNYIDKNSKLLSLKNDFNQHFADKESYTDQSLNLRDINPAISSNESSNEFYALQPLQQSSLLYFFENQPVQSSNRNLEIRNVQLNGKELLTYDSESSQILESPLHNQTENNFVTGINFLQSDSNFTKLTQAVESSDDFDKFLQPAIVEDYKKTFEADYSEHNKASATNNKLSDDASSLSSSGSLLFLPVSCSNQNNLKNSFMFNPIYTTANENESPLLSTNKSSELILNILNQVQKESDQSFFSTPENIFHQLPTQVEHSSGSQYPYHTPSNSNFFAHDSQQSLFIKPSLENYDKLSVESNHKSIYIRSQFEDVKNMPKKGIEIQSSSARSVSPSSSFSPTNILSLSSKQLDVRKISGINSTVSMSISELSDLQHMHQEKMSNYSSQHNELGSISSSMDLQEQDISSSDEEDQMPDQFTMQQSVQQISSQRSRNFVLPYFDDITMDFTARKISASSLPRISMNIEQDSFIPLPYQKGKEICSAPADKQRSFVENSSQDGYTLKANFDKSLSSMSAQVNVEDNKSAETDREDTFLSNLLEKNKFNDLTTELSVLSDLDLSLISGSVDWSSLAPFHNSVSPSQESLEKVHNLHSCHLDDSQKNDDGEISLNSQEDFCKSPKNSNLQQSVKSLSECKPVAPLEENTVLKSEPDHLKLDSEIVKERLVESKKRTKSLYEQLPEVRQRNARKEKDEVLKRNREKLKEYHEKLQRNLKKRAKKNR